MCTPVSSNFETSPSIPEGNLFVWQWDPKKVKGGWVQEEDALLLQLVSSLGPNWKSIASHFPSRTGKQCRERYINSLDPNIKSTPWSEEEDQAIIEYHKKSGNKWSEVAKLLPGRTANAIKNRWHSNLKRRLERLESPKQKKAKTTPSTLLENVPFVFENPFSGASFQSSSYSSSANDIFPFQVPEIQFTSEHGFDVEGISSDSESDSSFSAPSSPLSGDEIDMVLFNGFGLEEEKFYPHDIQDLLDFGNVNHLIYS